MWLPSTAHPRDPPAGIGKPGAIDAERGGAGAVTQRQKQLFFLFCFVFPLSRGDKETKKRPRFSNAAGYWPSTVSPALLRGASFPESTQEPDRERLETGPHTGRASAAEKPARPMGAQREEAGEGPRLPPKSRATDAQRRRIAGASAKREARCG